MPKIVIIGALASGKLKLARALNNEAYEDSYKEKVGAEFVVHKPSSDAQIEEPDSRLEIWATSGNSKYAPLLPMYLRKSNVLLYCVDLSKPINPEYSKKIQDELKNYAQKFPQTKIILVGTKADLCINEDAQKKLDAIDLGAIEHQRVLTSAKNDTCVIEKENKGFNGLREILFDISPTVTHTSQHHKQGIAGKYPPSYTHMWNKNLSGPRTSPERLQYVSAKELLLDYCKGSTSPGFFSNIASSLKLMATFHWRHHTSQVREVLYNLTPNEESEQSTQRLLEKLKETLEKGECIEPSGSLAQRINFIQAQTGLTTIDINAINNEIERKNAQKSIT